MASVYPTSTYGGQQPPEAYPSTMPPVQGSYQPQGNYPPPGSTQPQQAFAAHPMQQSQEPQDPENRIETGRWAAGLCGCCNNCIPNLCMSWCCPCVALAQVYARVGMGKYAYVLLRLFALVLAGLIINFVMPKTEASGHWDENGNYVYDPPKVTVWSVLGSLGYLVIQLSFMFHVLYARMRVRQRFQIPGSECCDCMIACCCSCCAIAQMATHVKSYTPGSCSFGGPDVLPAFK